jgi:hypothetical protein
MMIVTAHVGRWVSAACLRSHPAVDREARLRDGLEEALSVYIALPEPWCLQGLSWPGL